MTTAPAVFYSPAPSAELNIQGFSCDYDLMPAANCAFCHVRSNMAPQWAGPVPSKRESYGVSALKTSALAARCDNCGMLNLAIVQATYSLGWGYNGAASEVIQALEDPRTQKAWYPKSVDKYEFPNVPEGIARCAEEAHQAADVHANMAAILMARTTVEATAKQHGIETNGLVSKINGLRDAGIIRARIADAAHAIRYLGNDMAHADVGERPSDEDVSDTLKLMDALLTEVFDITATTESILARRQERKQR